MTFLSVLLPSRYRTSLIPVEFGSISVFTQIRGNISLPSLDCDAGSSINVPMFGPFDAGELIGNLNGDGVTQSYDLGKGAMIGQTSLFVKDKVLYVKLVGSILGSSFDTQIPLATLP